MTSPYSLQHVDTCLPCYVLDHCNAWFRLSWAAVEAAQGVES